MDWVHSNARKKEMFEGSSGSIPRTVCRDSVYIEVRRVKQEVYTASTTITTSKHTDILTSTSAVVSTCPKCGTFKKSGRVSCCAPGGSWYKNCGGSGNRRIGAIRSSAYGEKDRKTDVLSPDFQYNYQVINRNYVYQIGKYLSIS